MRECYSEHTLHRPTQHSSAVREGCSELYKHTLTGPHSTKSTIHSAWLSLLFTTQSYHPSPPSSHTPLLSVSAVISPFSSHVSPFLPLSYIPFPHTLLPSFYCPLTPPAPTHTLSTPLTLTPLLPSPLILSHPSPRTDPGTCYVCNSCTARSDAEMEQKCEGESPRSDPITSDCVETTAYTLLALLELGDTDRTGCLAQWLIKQQNSFGSFGSSQVKSYTLGACVYISGWYIYICI